MPKLLSRQEPNQECEYFRWDEGIVKRFKLDPEEIAKLEGDGVVWRGETAFTLEEED